MMRQLWYINSAAEIKLELIVSKLVRWLPNLASGLLLSALPAQAEQTQSPPGEPAVGPATSLSTGAAVTPVELVAILRNARVVAADYPLRASYNEREAVVTTKRNPQAKDNDCKIEAVMMTKALMDSFPEILRVKVLFSDLEQQKYTSVNLSKGDIASFGAGKLAQKDFLDSLEISTFDENVSPFASRSDGAVSTGVAPGPMQDKRLLLLSRIESLRSKGTNVKAYLDYFQTVEDAARSGDEAKVQNLVGSLSGKLNDQEKMREQAYATGVRSEVLRFQTQLQRYVVSGRKLPFDLGQVAKIQQLVVAGRNAEAKALMQTLEQKLR